MEKANTSVLIVMRLFSLVVKLETIPSVINLETIHHSPRFVTFSSNIMYVTWDGLYMASSTRLKHGFNALPRFS